MYNKIVFAQNISTIDVFVNKKENHNYEIVHNLKIKKPSIWYKPSTWGKYNIKERMVAKVFLWSDDITYEIEEFLKKYPECYIEDNKVYYKPYYVLTTTDGGKVRKHFEKVEDCLEEVNKLKSLSENIEFEIK